MNTRISYLYRDTSNYKQHNEVVVPRIFTSEQIEAIIGCLDAGEYFIPFQVGLPEERFGELTEVDHCLFEQQKSGFEATEKEPNTDMCIDKLFKNFLSQEEIGRRMNKHGKEDSDAYC